MSAEDRLAYGRIKGLIKRRLNKRLAGGCARYIVLVEEPEHVGILAEEVLTGEAKVVHAGTKEGAKLMDKFGVRPPCVLEKVDGGWRVHRVKKEGDTYYLTI